MFYLQLEECFDSKTSFFALIYIYQRFPNKPSRGEPAPIRKPN